jgi:hypothetical protein
VLRRHLLFFVTGALLALAAVLVVRAGDDGPSASAVTATTPAATPVARSVRLRTHRRAPHGHHKSATATAPPSKAPARGSAASGSTGATGGGARPGPAGSGIEPSPGTGTVPDDDPTGTVPDGGPTGTVPDGGTGTVPDRGDQTAQSPADGSAGVTIPNPATPDASVGAP